MNGVPMRNMDNPHHVDVLILGGGLAGLGAAYAISNLSNISDKCTYRILEAQNQAGGRVKIEEPLIYSGKTIQQPDHNRVKHHASYYVDAGAQWLHGSKNLLYSISQRNQLLLSEQSEEGVGGYFNEYCHQIDPFLVKKVDFHIGQLLGECEEFAVMQNGTFPKSVGHFLRERFEEFIDSLDNPKDKENAYDLFDWHVRFQIIDNSCLSLDQLSAKYWGKYSLNGESSPAHYNFKNCFGSIIDFIIDELHDNSIEYKKEVIEIQIHNKTNIQNISTANVSVKCSDGM